MRLIATFNSSEDAHTFVHFLKVHHIESHLELHKGRAEVWVLDEDKLDLAKECLNTFEQSEKKIIKPSFRRVNGFRRSKVRYKAPITRLFILICALVYLFSSVKTKEGFSFVQRELIYDYPHSLALAVEFSEKYPNVTDSTMNNLPLEGKKLLTEINADPPWPGLYEVILDQKSLYKSTLFESLRHFEVWRLVSPIFLHANILHILFNMLWLWLLGKMMETNLGAFRYIIFVIITATLTNTLQYLMTGPLFMGFSGVICAMGGYIWTRKKIAPWEVYPVDRQTLLFLGVFVFVMLFLQIVAFFLEFLHYTRFPMQIANTAHISGLIIGSLCGRIPLFQRKI